jgi:hypothetical protein
MVFICRCGIVNCRGKHATSQQQSCSEHEGAVIMECCGCPACIHEFEAALRPEPNRQQADASVKKVREVNLNRSELVALLESLRKATEAIQKILKAADEKAGKKTSSPVGLPVENTATAILHSENKTVALPNLLKDTGSLIIEHEKSKDENGKDENGKDERT